jgi:hypothetical protein
MKIEYISLREGAPPKIGIIPSQDVKWSTYNVPSKILD